MTRVLIVDDSPTETLKMRQMLEEQGFEVLEAASGEEGVEVAVEQLPDAILMDIVMPGLNGFQATRQISRDDRTAHIPVIIVTTKAQETDRLWGERQGAKGYLAKPVDGKTLAKVIKDLL